MRRTRKLPDDLILAVGQIADTLEAGLGDHETDDSPRALAADVLTVVMNLPDSQRADLQRAAKMLCDNLHPDIAVYTALGDFLRALERVFDIGPGRQMPAGYLYLRQKVFGD